MSWQAEFRSVRKESPDKALEELDEFSQNHLIDVYYRGLTNPAEREDWVINCNAFELFCKDLFSTSTCVDPMAAAAMAQHLRASVRVSMLREVAQEYDDLFYDDKYERELEMADDEGYQIHLAGPGDKG